MKKYFKEAIAITALVVIQFSIINSLFAPILYINLPLIIVLIFAISDQYSRSLYWAFFMGLIIGIFTYHRFGIDALQLITISAIIQILYNNFFTNASLASLAFIGLIAQSLYLGELLMISSLLNYIPFEFIHYIFTFRFSLFLQQILINTITLFFIYKIYSRWIRRKIEKYPLDI